MKKMAITILTLSMLGLSACESSDESLAVENPDLELLFENALEKDPHVYWTNQTEDEYDSETQEEITELSNALLSTMTVISDGDRSIDEERPYLSATYIGDFHYIIFPNNESPEELIYLEKEGDSFFMEGNEEAVTNLINYMEQYKPE